MLLNYEQRNNDFLTAVRRAARRRLMAGELLQSRSLVREALREPAPSYYVTTDYIWRRLREKTAGRLPLRGPRAEMLEEIEQRLTEMKKKSPEKDIFALLDDILSPQGPGASRFFIGEEYALRLFTGSARRHRRRLPASRKRPGDNIHASIT